MSQLATLLLVRPDNAQRDFKALLGKGFQFVKATSELNPKAVNIVSLSQAETIILETALAGNTQSIALLRALAGTALNECFCDAFDIESSAETRKAQIDARYGGIEVRNRWTDAIDVYNSRTPGLSDDAKRFVYPRVSDAVNVALTGFKASHWKQRLGSKTIRDRWTLKVLRSIEEIERHASVVLSKGGTPDIAIKSAIDFFGTPIDDSPVA